MQLHKVLGLTGLIFGLAAAVACGDDGGGGETGTGSGSGSGTGTGTGSGTSSGTATGTGSGTGSGTSAGTCTPTGTCTNPGGTATCGSPDPAHDGVSYNVGLVTAHILNLSGGPASNIASDVCGTNLCLFTSTDVNGNMSNDGGGQELIDVRLLYGGGRDYAKMGAPLPNGDSGAFGDIHAIDLPSFCDGVTMCPGSDATQGGVTLSIPAGAAIKHDLTIYGDPSEQVFRARVVDPSAFTFPAMDPSLNLELLIATAPIDSTICPAATRTFPNDAGWDADAEVEIFLHGTKTFQHYAPYGGWALVSDAVVSSDGLTVSTKPGEGVEMLAVFGARLK